MIRSVRLEDDAALRVMTTSAVGRVISAILERVSRAWRVSRTRAVLAGAVSLQPFVTRVRAVALMAIVASVTALALSLVGTRTEPLFWVVPAIVVALSLLVLWCAPRDRGNAEG